MGTLEAEQPWGEPGNVKWALDYTSFSHPSFPRYALASHFFWGLWSILQASMSTIEFGYLVSKPFRGHVGWGLQISSGCLPGHLGSP